MPYRLLFVTTLAPAQYLIFGGSSASVLLFASSFFRSVAAGNLAGASGSFLGGMGAFVIALTGLLKELERANRSRREHLQELARIEAELKAGQARIEAERKAELAKLNRETRQKRHEERNALQAAFLQIEELKRVNRELIAAVGSNRVRIDRVEQAGSGSGSGIFPARPDPDAPPQAEH